MTSIVLWALVFSAGVGLAVLLGKTFATIASAGPHVPTDLQLTTEQAKREILEDPNFDPLQLIKDNKHKPNLELLEYEQTTNSDDDRSNDADGVVQ